MKKILNIAVLSVLILGSASCDKWLDVNVDPDSPNNESALVENRLPWIQHFYSYAMGPADMRTSCISGALYSTNANNNHLSTTWNCQPGSTTTAEQIWFVNAACNLPDLYNKAEKEGAYYYMGAAEVIHAMGFMMLLDTQGEMPYTEALAGIASPKYDDGKTIFNGCIDKLDHAIELFKKEQEPTATPFSVGDMWCGGDPDKWIKLAYGLKARYLLRLSKKADLFDPDTILDCISKGPQSNDENIFMVCYNSANDVTDYWMGDPIMTNPDWDYVAYGSTQRISKFYKDLLVNMRNAGVEDPRMPKIVPATMGNIKTKVERNEKGKVTKVTLESYDWIRSEGVDSYGEATRLLAGGPATIQTPTYVSGADDKDAEVKYVVKDAAERAKFIAGLGGKPYTVDGENVTVTYKIGSLYCSSNNYKYAGDTIYVNIRSNSQKSLSGSGQPADDVNWYTGAAQYNVGVVSSTGSFQVHPNSDYDILTYYEMCFIKAEVLFRKGDPAGALAAYKAGIKAHMERMQRELKEWVAGGFSKTNPDMTPMDEDDITAYLASAAVAQSAGELTMKDIMLQKYIAMGFNIENWNDMRRFNFSAGNIDNFGVIYEGYDRGPLFAGQAKLVGTSKTDPQYWVRRWRLPATTELNYNATNAKAANKHATEDDIWSIPVWWDCATDEEYYGYIK